MTPNVHSTTRFLFNLTTQATQLRVVMKTFLSRANTLCSWRHLEPLAVSSRESHPANMRRWPSVGLLLDKHRRRWANSEQMLDQRLMFAGQSI